MARTTRRFLALAALTAAVAAPSASAYPDSFRPEYSVSSGLAAKMRIEDGAAQAHGGPRFLIDGPAQVSAPVTSASAAPDSGSVDLSAMLVGLAVGAALAGGALALLISRDARRPVGA